MHFDENVLNPKDKKKDNKKSVKVKVDFIYGIRRDLVPNLYQLDNETIVYPAANYVVIANVSRMGGSKTQTFIAGRPNSKGITSISTSGLGKKIVAISEETNEHPILSFYHIVAVKGLTRNYPELIEEVPLIDREINFKKVYSIAFSTKKTSNNYIIAITSNEQKLFYFVWWKLNLEKLTDKEKNQTLINKNTNTFITFPKRENEIKFLRISFPISAIAENETFCVVSDHFIVFYKLTNTIFDPLFTIEADDDVNTTYGSEILSYTWLHEGDFCFLTNTNIVILDGKKFSKKTVIENYPPSSLKIVSPYHSGSIEGFVCAGVDKKLEVYGKSTENMDNELDNSNMINEPFHMASQGEKEYKMLYEKKKYEFMPGLNEKINGDKLTQNDKSQTNDSKFEFHSLCTFSKNDQFVIASTSNNDLCLIDISPKGIERTQVKYLFTPFHSKSIEGLDCCINQPYLITCSKDGSLRVWNYSTKEHVICKIFDEDLYSVSYHPSGMHALVSTNDKIYPLNIYYDEIDTMTGPIPLKTKSKDIKFAHLGHLFAYDTGVSVQIWEFLNMQLLTGPPPYGQMKKSFNTTTSKINYLSWNADDKNLLICGNEFIYDWRVKEDHIPLPKLAGANVLSAAYLPYCKTYIATTEDTQLRILGENAQDYTNVEYDFSMKELNAFKKSKIVICATTKYGLYKSDLNDAGFSLDSNKHLKNETMTTCLRIFPDIIKNNKDYIDIPSHFGETTRIRYNFDENKVFTCGEDGCLISYNIESFESDPDNQQRHVFSEVVLIKKARFKDRDFEKKELPAKKEEKKKKNQNEYADNREKEQKELTEIKTERSNMIQRETNEIEAKKNKLEQTKADYQEKIRRLEINNDEAYNNQFNANQNALSEKTNKVEEIRKAIKKHKDDFKANLLKEEEDANNVEKKRIEEFENEKKTLEANIADLEGQIKYSEQDKFDDDAALKWLNEEVIVKLKSNIDVLKGKIDELRVHYAHHIKKQKEEKERLHQVGETLRMDGKKLEEEINKQKKFKETNTINKENAQKALEDITNKISAIETKIIECKKTHTYLEKCKFVLSYKIQELKKEAGPMEKVLEDLQKRTKEDELSLSKYNREFDIINQKLVDLEDLKEKTKTHERTERDLNNEINNFKIDLNNMLDYIDDYDKLREGFRNLREKYLKNYVPEVQDHELEGEFANQKSKMKNKVFELQETLNELKEKHRENIYNNRKENDGMIRIITDLKKEIKEEKRTKATINGDQKHANAVAEICAGQYVKKLMLEDISLADKIQLFKKEIKLKKKKLKMIKKSSGIKNDENTDGNNVDDEDEDDDDEEDEDEDNAEEIDNMMNIDNNENERGEGDGQDNVDGVDGGDGGDNAGEGDGDNGENAEGMINDNSGEDNN